MGEVGEAQVGSSRSHHARDERELVVLHEHLLTLGRALHDDVGERGVHRHVALPRLAEVAVEAGSAGEVEQAVVQEPQHLVGDHVVVQAVQRRIELEQVQVEPGHDGSPRCDRGAVAVVDRRRDPRRASADVVALHQRQQRAHQTTRAALRCERAVVALREPERPSVRDDDHLRSVPNRVSQSSSSRVERKFSRTCSRPCTPIASAPTGSASSSIVRCAHSSTESTR